MNFITKLSFFFALSTLFNVHAGLLDDSKGKYTLVVTVAYKLTDTEKKEGKLVGQMDVESVSNLTPETCETKLSEYLNHLRQKNNVQTAYAVCSYSDGFANF